VLNTRPRPLSLLTVAGLLSLGLAACSSTDVSGAPSVTAPSSASSSAAAGAPPSSAAPSAATVAGQCDFTTEAGGSTGGKNPGLPPATKTTGGKNVTATIVTSVGTVKATLLGSKAPCTVASFTHLAQKKFFDDTTCHRLVTEGIFVLQCGDPTGSGSGGPGYTIPDENLTGATYPAGTMAMANTGQPHTGGSQFFICYRATPLPPQYTPFGKVTAGLDVVQKVAKAGSTNSNGSGDGAPKTKVTIKTFRVS